MRRNIIKVLLVAMFAILFFAVVPSVSASAATGGGAPVGCSPATCTAPPAPVQTLTPKDPSRDVAPPQGTVPLNLDGCEVSAPCTQDALAAAQSAIRALFISIAVGLVVAVLVFWFSVATINRRHRQELESKKAIPSYTLH